MNRQFQSTVATNEMPIEAPAEVALPDVEDEANRSVEMRHLELRRSKLEIVEMAIRIGFGGGKDRALPWREEHVRRIGWVGLDAVGRGLTDRMDGVYPVIRGAWPDTSGR